MGKYLRFEKMITPKIIQVLFWIGVALSIISGIITMVGGISQMFSPYGSGFTGFFIILWGFAIMILGTIVSRIYCELLIILFKVYESLVSINNKLEQKED